MVVGHQNSVIPNLVQKLHWKIQFEPLFVNSAIENLY